VDNIKLKRSEFIRRGISSGSFCGICPKPADYLTWIYSLENSVTDKVLGPIARPILLCVDCFNKLEE
jgi:hypothetical protein